MSFDFFTAVMVGVLLLVVFEICDKRKGGDE